MSRLTRIFVLAFVLIILFTAMLWQKRKSASQLSSKQPAAKAILSACPLPEISREHLFTLISQYRTQLGYKLPLELSPLDDYAALRAAEIKSRGTLSHDTVYSDLATWLEKNNKTNQVPLVQQGGRELLALGYPDACALVNSWKSPKKDGILEESNFDAVGIGVVDRAVVVVDGNY